jgi:hypothetical protein
MSLQPPRALHVAIVGSCVSRDPFALAPASEFQVTSYLARQSFAGLAGPALRYEPSWYDGLNGFERRCVIADLEKNDDYWAFERDADVLIVDYIDERFPSLCVGAARLSDTRNVRQPLFEAAYSETLRVERRASKEVREAWLAGAEVFFARALKTLPATRIILHEAYWASEFRFASSERKPMSDAMIRSAEDNNQLLEEMHCATKSLVPGLRVVRPPSDVLFADPEHKWSKEPFHYIPAYDAAFLRLIRERVQAAPAP